MADREQLEQSVIKILLFTEDFIQSAIDSKLIDVDFKYEPYKKIYSVLVNVWQLKAPGLKLDTSKLIEFIRFNDIDIEESMLVGLQDELPSMDTAKKLKKYIKQLKSFKG